MNAWTEGRQGLGTRPDRCRGRVRLTDPDSYFFYSASEDDASPTGSTRATSKIWTGLPFVQKGNLTHFPAGTWTFGGPASVMRIAEQMVAALTA